MKNLLTYLILLIVAAVVGCGYSDDVPSKPNEQLDDLTDVITWDSIKNSTSHVDYLHFLMDNSDTTHFNEAIISYLKYRDLLRKNDGETMLPCTGYASVLVNQKGQVLFNDTFIQKDSVRMKSFNYFVNNTDDIELFMNKQIEDSEGNLRLISKGFFEVSFIKDTCPNLNYLIREIGFALSDYKQFLVEEWFPNNEELQVKNRELLDSYYFERLFLYDYSKDGLNNPRFYEIVPPSKVVQEIVSKHHMPDKSEIKNFKFLKKLLFNSWAHSSIDENPAFRIDGDGFHVGTKDGGYTEEYLIKHDTIEIFEYHGGPNGMETSKGVITKLTNDSLIISFFTGGDNIERYVKYKEKN